MELNTEVRNALTSPERLAVLKSVVPDLDRPDGDFDDIVKVAAGLFDAPVALVTLVDSKTQWFKAAFGTQETHAPSEDSFCAHTIADAQRDPLVVLDPQMDERFVSQPRVSGPPHFRFYAGVPVIIDNEAVGTICVFDVKPRQAVAPATLDLMRGLARLAASLFKLKDDARKREMKETLLLQQEKRHSIALESANVGSWLWDVKTGMISANAATARMFALPVQDHYTVKEILSAVHPEDRASTVSKLRDAMDNETEYHGTFRIAATGRWLLGRGRIHDRDATGRPTSFLGINIDVTEEQSSTQRTRLLLRELNHRVKNTLAMLQSLARQTLRTTSDPQQFMTAFAGRLQAISEAHGLLSDHEWGAIRLSALVSKQLAPHVRDFDSQIEVHKDEITLGPDQAVGLGLVLHELATNAAKYGALSVRGGRIILTARKLDEGDLQVLNLTWTEVGGPPVTAPDKRGFGSILIERSLDKVMGSSVKMEYLPAGLTAIIRLPL